MELCAVCGKEMATYTCEFCGARICHRCAKLMLHGFSCSVGFIACCPECFEQSPLNSKNW